MRCTSSSSFLQSALFSLSPPWLGILVASGVLLVAPTQAGEPISHEVFKSSSGEVETTILPEGTLEVELAAGAKGSPGAIIQPGTAESWDFSEYSRIEAVIQNTGDHSVPVSLRVDNKGHWKEAPWSNESIRLDPGQTGTVVVFFGYSHGMKPSFALDRSKVTQLLIFAPGGEQSRRFLVKSISAEGEPGETPEEWKNQSSLVPEGGILLGPGAPVESSRQLSSFNGAGVTATESGDRLQIQFTGESQHVSFRPLPGKWDLRAANRLAVEVINTGTGTAWPGIRIESPGGATAIASSKAPLPAGEKTVIIVPFTAAAPWLVDLSGTSGTEKQPDESGTNWVSKEATAITFLSGRKEGIQAFEVIKMEAIAPPAVFPNWIGNRPPVEGDWVQTLSEEFDATVLDESIWNPAAVNHWDKGTGFSRDNVIVADGVARLRFEHRTSRHNDEPDGEEKNYTTGFLDTFGKWTQRYGYFEARMKLPDAPGLWPAFWMMPDRGPATAPRWKREQTTNGGMEFDIMEYLSGWGPYRYNVAFHWDGYGKGHLHAGTSGIYFQTDEEGFLTAGLLWLPGKAVYYCNGVEVGRWESDRISSVPSILMFTHVSGGWDNEPLDNARLPCDFVIDYVRCWQRRDLE
ncbi:MAG: glycoside hydrolase family 16 protein [Verrucomicrobiales bacterium]|nr:glycoside hydrolase family 16 protein [Verrucomicrobiales bacterium]